ncbi:NAD(P)-binding protein [Cryphonectria parasitica EP155]|uniref:NAD(P)-binding protein n=1 Tax=Cryphonectria parasitica (strain ATCC 38755 / EP155) TaxID=660469 RepID=A0A9P4XUE8_CRYP1|nr:NAD(P)-binding protein [Cryphonectria parasitica EP155]KAF3761078.1 NAD(P)-binding protein [Cryphonectria parasitica EP155]
MTMHIAIAGGGGLAYILAREITQSTDAVLVLSTQLHPEFDDLGVQQAVVNYADVQQLRYTLRGVDLVISTIPGESQLNLIDAARHAQVRTFVPSEFEGALAQRPTSDDPLDRGSVAALRLLDQWSQSTSTHHGMRYTVFSCGIFYERFASGGLATLSLGAGEGVQNPGDYLLNVDAATAEVVAHTAQGRPIDISMTSIYDVARFVAAAIEIGPEHWPRELRMRGDHMTVTEIVRECSSARRVPFNLVNHEYRNIQAHLDYWLEHDFNRWFYFQRLRATADGRYTFGRSNINDLIAQNGGVEVRPVRFRDWARRALAAPQQNQHHMGSNAMQLH